MQLMLSQLIINGSFIKLWRGSNRKLGGYSSYCCKLYGFTLHAVTLHFSPEILEESENVIPVKYLTSETKRGEHNKSKFKNTTLDFSAKT